MPLARATVGGKTFTASRRTIDHLNWTKWKLRFKYPWARLEIIQPCYNAGVEASAGTHDKDCVFDVRIRGIKWLTAQRFLRYHGWAAWYRTPAQGFGEHIHMISLPKGLTTNKPTLTQIRIAYSRLGQEIGTLVPSQVYDFYRHALGLKGGHTPGCDRTAYPGDINKYVFKEKN